MIALVAIPIAFAIVAAVTGIRYERQHRFKFQAHSERLTSIR